MKPAIIATILGTISILFFAGLYSATRTKENHYNPYDPPKERKEKYQRAAEGTELWFAEERLRQTLEFRNSEFSNE